MPEESKSEKMAKILFFAESAEQEKKSVHQIRKTADMFAQAYGVAINFTTAVVHDIIRMYSRDIKKVCLLDEVDPNKYRQAAALAIWIARLKPAKITYFADDSVFKNERKIWAVTNINELFALFIALAMVIGRDPALRNRFESFGREHIVGDSAYDDIISIIRYRVASRHAIALLLRMLDPSSLSAASIQK
jgi:hypothetical protein